MSEPRQPLTICDLTQSYTPRGGGGITTFLREKARYVLEHTPHKLVQIVPGPRDEIFTLDERHLRVEVGAKTQPGTSDYRFILRTGAVRQVLEQFRPDLIESQCPWVLPWTAIRYARKFSRTALVAGFHTDFPRAQIHRVFAAHFGPRRAALARRLAEGHARRTYANFDRVYVLGKDGREALARYGVPEVSQIDLGVNAIRFHPGKADPAFREEVGHAGDGPLLIYAGRLDPEKRPAVLIEAMRRLPAELGARLVIIGDGRSSDELRQKAEDLPVHFLGFVSDRDALARALASSDIYVSGMADETFGLSILEAQASGLAAVGINEGAMVERVEPGTGLLGPRDDADAMAANVLAVWNGDHAAMGKAARALVEERYSWDHTFHAMFNECYPAAFEAMEARQGALSRPILPRLRDRWGEGKFGKG